MSVPKPIHKYLLGEGFRYGGQGVYYKLLPGQPVAHAVAIHETWGWLPGRFIKINLDLVFPYFFPYVTVIGGGETLCTDGLLRPDADLSLYWKVEQHAQALEVLQATMHKWLDALSNPDIMIPLEDYYLELRAAPPEPFGYIAEFYADGKQPGQSENLSRAIREIAAATPGWEEEIQALRSGQRAEPLIELQGLASSIYKDKRAAINSLLREKTRYLLLAGRYAEAEDLLLHHAVVQKYARGALYHWMLACAQQKKIIVLDDFREWAEKKKLVQPGTWESVPESTFADPAKEVAANTAASAGSFAGDMEDMYAIFFSGGRKAAAAYLQAQHGVDITGRRGKRVEDALDAACDDDESQLILCAPNRRWSVLMGSVAQVADEEGEDTALSRHLSAASKTGKDGAGSEVLFICSQDTAGALWLEYHRNGECLRQWACADGEVLANTGAPLGELDARTFGAEIGEDGPPESGTLMELAEKITGISRDALCTPGAAFALE